MLTTDNYKSNNKLSEVNYKIKSDFKALVTEYVKLAKDKYNIDFRVPKLVIDKDPYGVTLGVYNWDNKTLRIYSSRLLEHSKGIGENIDEIRRVVSHELGHSLSNQLTRGLDYNPYENYGEELIADIFGAMAIVKLKGKNLDNKEIAKQLLNNKLLSPSLINGRSNQISDGLNVLSESFDKLNKDKSYFNKLKWVDRKNKNSRDITFKAGEHLSDYKGFYDIIGWTGYNVVSTNRYSISNIVAAKALMNGKSVDYIINAAYNDKELFDIEEFSKYKPILESHKCIMSVLLDNGSWGDSLRGLHSKKGFLHTHKKDYHSEVKPLEYQIKLIEYSVDKTIKGAHEALKDLKDLDEIAPKLTLFSYKLRR